MHFAIVFTSASRKSALRDLCKPFRNFFSIIRISIFPEITLSRSISPRLRPLNEQTKAETVGSPFSAIHPSLCTRRAERIAPKRATILCFARLNKCPRRDGCADHLFTFQSSRKLYANRQITMCTMYTSLALRAITARPNASTARDECLRSAAASRPHTAEQICSFCRQCCVSAPLLLPHQSQRAQRERDGGRGSERRRKICRVKSIFLVHASPSAAAPVQSIII